MYPPSVHVFLAQIVVWRVICLTRGCANYARTTRRTRGTARMVDATVLVLANDRFVAALLGALVELSGRHAAFPHDGEPTDTAAKRVHADLMLLDCALGGNRCAATAALAQRDGVRILMFSAAHTDHEARDIARRYGAQSFALPVSPREFSHYLDSALTAESPASSAR